MRTNEEFIAGLEALYSGEPWYGESIQAKLQNVTETQALQRPKVGEHSIAEIVSHMAFWRSALLARIRGEVNGHFSSDNPDNWPAIEELKKKGWKAIKQSFDATQTGLIEALRSAKLSDDLTATISGTFEHDVYHLGQIGFVKKLVS